MNDSIQTTGNNCFACFLVCPDSRYFGLQQNHSKIKNLKKRHYIKENFYNYFCFKLSPIVYSSNITWKCQIVGDKVCREQSNAKLVLPLPPILITMETYYNNQTIL